MIAKKALKFPRCTYSSPGPLLTMRYQDNSIQEARIQMVGKLTEVAEEMLE